MGTPVQLTSSHSRLLCLVVDNKDGLIASFHDNIKERQAPWLLPLVRDNRDSVKRQSLEHMLPIKPEEGESSDRVAAALFGSETMYER